MNARIFNLAGVWALSIFVLASTLRAATAPVEFVGAHTFTPDQLRAQLADPLTEISERGLTPARADDAAFFLSAYYRKQGFQRAEVTYKVLGQRLVLTVREGPRTLIRSLRFTGNHHHDALTLSEYVTGVRPEKLVERKIPFSETELAAGVDRIRGFFASEGWLDATADTEGTRLSDTAADLVVNIHEGTYYTFGEITFAGDVRYTRAELIEGLGAKPEGPLKPYAIDAMQRSLQTWLRGRGHFAATVNAEWAKTPGGRVPVKFTVSPGVKFRVGSVEPRGLDRVTPQFIEKRFSKITGSTYDPAKLDEKYRELLRTGLFRTLRISPVQTGPATLKIEVEAEESKQKEFGVELGYGSYDGGTAGIRLADLNFLRSGRPLSLRLEYSQRGFRGELLHEDPWLFDGDLSLRSRLFSELREEQGYKKNVQGVRFDLSRKITPSWQHTAFIEASNASITSDEIAPELLGPPDYLFTAIGISQTLDRRDDPLNTHRGYIFTTTFDLDLLDGQLAFARTAVRYSQYRTIGRSLVALGLRAGWIIPIEGDEFDVPIDLRFYNGGGTTVRSFADRGLGPHDKGGHPLGGTFYTVANLEWDFPIKGELGGALFADVGNLTAESSPSLDDLRYAIGVGLRYNLPIGPMRLDYGFNPDARDDEDAGAFHFSFGFAF